MSDDNDFTSLYLQTITIADFLISKDKNKKEVIPGMNEIVQDLRDSIEHTHDRGDRRGLQLLLNDFREMADGLNESEIAELVAIFEEKKIDWPD